MVASKTMSLQHQVHSEYHSDLLLRDRLQKVVYNRIIKDAIKYRTPPTSHPLMNRVANSPSNHPRTARSVSSLVSLHAAEQLEEEGMYTLVQSYGGDAK